MINHPKEQARAGALPADHNVAGQPSQDAFLAWCEAHGEDLARHPNAHIAITLEDGILFACESDEEFERRLRALDPSVRERTFLTASFTVLLFTGV